MNRKDRRAEASRQRRGVGDDTMGRGYTVIPFDQLPKSVTESGGFKAGLDAARKGELPPGYYLAIEDAAALIRRWLAEHPGADLKWLEWDAGRTFISAALDVGRDYLCDSPDAFALIEWLDAQTGRQLSLNMAGWALRIVGQIPMPPSAA